MKTGDVLLVRERLIKSLLEVRSSRGFWQGRLSSDTQSTAAALAALREDGPHAGVQRGLAYLVGCQNADGGVGFAKGAASDMDASGAFLAALTLCDERGTHRAAADACRRYCEDRGFKTRTALSGVLLGVAGFESELRVPNVKMDDLPHPERMMVDLVGGYQLRDPDRILRHGTVVDGTRSWRGLLALTGVAETCLVRMGVSGDRSAAHWLAAQQNPDGGFPHTHSLAVWDTVVASLALLDAGVDPGSASWLMSVQDSSGGWFWDPERMAYIDLDDIGYSLLVLLRSGVPMTHPSIRKAVDAVRGFQNPDGGFPTFEKAGASIARTYWNGSVADVTSHVLLGLKAAKMSAQADAAETWLLHDAVDGLWKGFWFLGDLFSTLSALEAIEKTALRLDEIRDRVLGLQHEDGSFGASSSSIEETAWGIGALVEVGEAKSSAVKRAVAWLCARVSESLAPSHVGALPLFDKRYSDSVLPVAFALGALTKYLESSKRG